MDNIFDKYDTTILSGVDKENAHNIIKFLTSQKCYYIDDILSDYFDLFIIKFDEFKDKFDMLNKKFNGLFIEKAGSDMNLWELFFC